MARREQQPGARVAAQQWAGVASAAASWGPVAVASRLPPVLFVLLLSLMIATCEFAAPAAAQTAPEWAQSLYLKASNGGNDDVFGAQVSISGDRMAVGAHGEDSCSASNPGDDGCVESGIVYIFEREPGGTWFETALLKASNARSGDQFGWSVSLDGDRVAVGARYQASCNASTPADTSCAQAGAAYVFQYSSATQMWTEEAFLKAFNAGSQDEFGFSVSLDGVRLAVGAPHEDSCNITDPADNNCDASGAAYLFTVFANAWRPLQAVKPQVPRSLSRFGWTVSLYNGVWQWLAVGAPRHPSCAVGVDGNEGDVGCEDAGAVYLFSGIFTLAQAHFIKPSIVGDGDAFGYFVSLDGSRLAVGAVTEDSCHGNQPLNDGCEDAGAAYVFDQNATGSWSQSAYLKPSVAGSDDQFGVSLSLQGGRLAVGAHLEDSCALGVDGPALNNGCPDSGAVYIFDLFGATNWTQTAYLKPAARADGDAFGVTVSLDQARLVVGAYLENSCSFVLNGTETNNGCNNAGAAYLFTDLTPLPGATTGLGVGTLPTTTTTTTVATTTAASPTTTAPGGGATVGATTAPVATTTAAASTGEGGVGEVSAGDDSGDGNVSGLDWLIPVVAAAGGVVCLALLAVAVVFALRRKRDGETEDLPAAETSVEDDDAAPIYNTTAHVSVRDSGADSPIYNSVGGAATTEGSDAPIYNSIGDATPADAPIYNSIGATLETGKDDDGDARGSIYNTTDGIREN